MTKRDNQKRAKALLASFMDTETQMPDLLVFWSFRYFLGRMTIQTCRFAEDLAHAWPYLNKQIAKMIKEELEEEFRRDDMIRAYTASGDLLYPSLEQEFRRDDMIRAKNQVSLEKYYPLGRDCDRTAWECVRRAYAANVQDQTANGEPMK